MNDSKTNSDLAVEVMGWRQIEASSCGDNKCCYWHDTINKKNIYSFSPLTSLSDSWILVEKMRLESYEFLLMLSANGKKWFVEFTCPDGRTVTFEDESPARAISIAALSAKRKNLEYLNFSHLEG